MTLLLFFGAAFLFDQKISEIKKITLLVWDNQNTARSLAEQLVTSPLSHFSHKLTPRKVPQVF